MDSVPFSVYQSWAEIGQAHLFHYWETLNLSEKNQLIESLKSLSPTQIHELSQSILNSKTEKQLTDIQSPDVITPSDLNPNELDAIKAASIHSIQSGKIAALTAAGGQGTRLNHPGPKGTFPATPILRKSLFQVFAEKLIAISAFYKARIHWFIMTSPINHDETITFFRDNNYFQYPQDCIHFFKQGLLPAFNLQGQLLLENPFKLALSPDGHGGIFQALKNNGFIETFRHLKIETVSYFQIDNPLIQPIDPLFIGLHKVKQSNFSSKCISKKNADEKVGLFIKENGKIKLIEYSDAPPSLLLEKNPQGQLRFSAANIAVHLIDTTFIEKIAHTPLSYHFAHKKITYIDYQNTLIKPSEPNAIKCEQFIFDALPFAENPLILETTREKEFSPIKNATGPDSPETCHKDQMNLWRNWFLQEGLCLENHYPIEISSLWAYDETTFKIQYKKNTPLKPPTNEWVLN
jgi:UDP-N-acetylglucosamine/UDP-N-acetylgalactosamine diphosphorylase